MLPHVSFYLVDLAWMFSNCNCTNDTSVVTHTTDSDCNANQLSVGGYESTAIWDYYHKKCDCDVVGYRLNVGSISSISCGCSGFNHRIRILFDKCTVGMYNTEATLAYIYYQQ